MARMAFGLSENIRAGGSAASRASCDTRTFLEVTIHCVDEHMMSSHILRYINAEGRTEHNHLWHLV